MGGCQGSKGNASETSRPVERRLREAFAGVLLLVQGDVLIIFISFCTAQSPFATENLLKNLTTSRQATVFYQSYKSVCGYLKLFEYRA